MPAAIQRATAVTSIYRLSRPVTGRGTLSIAWTDSLGRLIEHRRVSVTLNHASQIAFTLDTRRAVALTNHLTVGIAFKGSTPPGKPDGRIATASTSFTVPLPGKPWADFQIIMWQGQDGAQYQALRNIGITAGRVQANRNAPLRLDKGEMQPLLAANLPWFIENIATDFYSAYHLWTPAHPVDWRFTAVQKLYRRDPTSRAALIRHPSLSNPAWLRKISERLKQTVTAYRAWHPLYYNLADEAGIANTAAFWDFDLSSYSISGMRVWLKQRYGSLAALNAEWGTTFKTWNDVIPETTTQALARTDDNFAPWEDFKAWMDVAFAHALKLGTRAVHSADPTALAAIEGGQVPGWGGYDYTRLAKAVDVMELYDGRSNIAIVRSLNPRVVLLTTLFKSGPSAERQVWHELLKGTRGLILWDAKHAFVNPDGTLGPRGQEAAPYFRKIRDGLGALIINSRPAYDPIAILYSPSSQRLQWLLDWRGKGDGFTEHPLASSYADTPYRASTRRFVRALEGQGFAPRFVSDAMIARGDLRRKRYRLLILPDTIALSPAEAAQIRRFAQSGGVVLADHIPGRFDSHGRKLAHPLLGNLLRPLRLSSPEAKTAGLGNLYIGGNAQGLSELATQPRKAFDAILRGAGMKTGVGTSVVAQGEVRREPLLYRFRNGQVILVALQRGAWDAEQEQGDCGGPNASGEEMQLKMPRRGFVYDLGSRSYLGKHRILKLRLGCLSPAILALSPTKLPRLRMVAPRQVQAGDTAKLRFSFSAPSPATTDILHVDVIDPEGKPVPYYSRNLPTARGKASLSIPFALSDPAGMWIVHARDTLSGRTTTAEIHVVTAPPNRPVMEDAGRAATTP